ncbi:MAG: PIN/TRAM domain-containing protein [Planctomycetes bacterium]|nr:PIN/TRAM domain-containing protein [Planctomycetota bacterium]NOG55287.1 PIN/TRAM domain-containing protein [Planctomycetota bacterium]
MPDPRLINPLEEAERSKRRTLIFIRGVFLIMLVTMVMLSLLKTQESKGSGAGEPGSPADTAFIDYWWVPLAIAAFLGVIAIFLDALTPRKRLSGLSSIIFGLMVGLLATVALSWVVDLLLQAHDIDFQPDHPVSRIILAIKAAFAITLCYLGVSVVYTTQDEFRLIIPYVEFSKQMRGTRPIVLDTSAVIDGRLNDIAHTGFISMPVVIPRFVINELQTLSDSSDRLKRNRGRRGLDLVRKMQGNPHLDLTISDMEVPGAGVDQMLIAFTKEHQAHLVTTDFNLNKVASIHGVKVLNINDLASALKPVAVPGEQMSVEIVKRGEGESQGVGYLSDGTMVVVEGAADLVNAQVHFVVTSSIQTSAGRMIFGERTTGAAASPEPSHRDDGDSPRQPEQQESAQ